MKHEEHCRCKAADKANDIQLKVTHRDEESRTSRTEELKVAYCWTTISEGHSTLKYTRYCECDKKVQGKFSRVVKWAINC